MAAIPFVLGTLGLALGGVRWVANRRVEVAQDAGGGEEESP
jgi:hypothetical protein